MLLCEVAKLLRYEARVSPFELAKGACGTQAPLSVFVFPFPAKRAEKGRVKNERGGLGAKSDGVPFVVEG